ncbi:hypothetical protein WJX72_004017 [[Myrmecia] bisecta]|uniref:Multidrug and toxin extrusion protein n=1 Tax=[Myrmecia] bisecta TaxID=41462 RepID=A0AAW1PFX2_9CHLO
MMVQPPEAYSSYAAIAKVALPAILLNVAQPLTVAVQTALLGTYGSHSQAAFAAVDTTCRVATCLFNYLVDGVSARCGTSVGQRNWKGLQTRVRLALSCSAVCGGLVAALLALLKGPVFYLLSLEPAVAAVARPYWWIRVGCVPIVLINMAVNGILQGYNRMAINATLTTAQSLLELGGSIAVLTQGAGLSLMGGVTLATSGLAAMIGLVCIAALNPREAFHAAEQAREPLLAESDAQDSVQQEGLRNKTAECAEGDGGEGPMVAVVVTDLLEFIRDGGNMMLRSALLQATFFIALAAASQLGTAQLAAHQIVAQLWLLTAYAVDGVANAGTVLGSRLAAQAGVVPVAARSLERLVARVLCLGSAVGAASGIAVYLWQSAIIGLFTSDESTMAVLAGPLWLVVSGAQPLNAAVFVYDGLLYASHSFAWTRSAVQFL